MCVRVCVCVSVCTYIFSPVSDFGKEQNDIFLPPAS